MAQSFQPSTTGDMIEKKKKKKELSHQCVVK